ncbi:hypothetical protein EVAR_5163_1 [Eumeta japonica]|uniref:Uncharacterized protein n=1 Tax=Eumeta variegata TaxID=151549 RepID=A0A4C1SX84_EUMVA|nr:hypothetical protein EVAR_5163_1 [Eumeta japonica]
MSFGDVLKCAALVTSQWDVSIAACAVIHDVSEVLWLPQVLMPNWPQTTRFTENIRSDVHLANCSYETNNIRKRSAPRPKEFGGPPSDPTACVNIGRASSVVIGLVKMSCDGTNNVRVFSVPDNR